MDATVRRSANYKPSIWNDEYIQSLHSVYGDRRFLERAEKLKGEVTVLLEKTGDPCDQIELVDVLQRLGICYHFSDYVDRILKNICVLVGGDQWNIDNLHAAGLRFRLLRQHGYDISPEVFRSFMDQTGNFRTILCDDVEGLLSLYEASYLSMEGESILDAAKVFATHHLKQKLKQNINKNLAEEIRHSLEVPYHCRMLRLETRRFIDAYERRRDTNPLLLELGKLGFNILQKMYQDELKELSRWHTNSRLAEKLSFARDRLVECFLWTVGFTFEPCHRYCRIMLVKLAVLITIIDDIYDVYGTLDELELFTDAVDRWDINALKLLPDYMKICFLALYNTVNEMAYDVLRDQGFNIIPHSTNRVEFLFSLHSLTKFQIVPWSHIFGVGAVGRNLKEVHGGSTMDELKRGDNPKSIQCYMHDTGCCEEDSRSFIKNLIGSTWRKINNDVLMNHEHSKDFIKASINYARISQCMYQYGDGHGIPDRESKARILSLLIEPIPLS
ncbi:UNVERIFIED_CONTAM: (+)-epi-alpha-bisabolol synthase [Sesamum radiatum]|uniref:(+)-epi-alpha-bisabolol synthase n=1 Tax=Sesamum radiatum TaxID=300843 RepID=A0AAW2UNQ4_SESRA